MTDLETTPEERAKLFKHCAVAINPRADVVAPVLRDFARLQAEVVRLRAEIIERVNWWSEEVSKQAAIIRDRDRRIADLELDIDALAEGRIVTRSLSEARAEADRLRKAVTDATDDLSVVDTATPDRAAEISAYAIKQARSRLTSALQPADPGDDPDTNDGEDYLFRTRLPITQPARGDDPDPVSVVYSGPFGTDEYTPVSPSPDLGKVREALLRIERHPDTPAMIRSIAHNALRPTDSKGEG